MKPLIDTPPKRETPRVDAEVWITRGMEVVSAEFARGLARELATLTAIQRNTAKKQAKRKRKGK